MVHAWQSGEAGIGRVTGTVAMEQLSLLLVRRSRTGGWPTFAVFAKVGSKEFGDHSRFLGGMLSFPGANPSEALLRHQTSAFHHLQLLSPPALVGECASARLVSTRFRTSPPTIWLRGRRVRGDARAYSPSDQ
jgi:hypothetical protein